ncbi:MAG: hypothetical protein Greene041619_995 [Candidatus Peregrinibacteria bacterium Greene0416_19]|nr:MAG: hypothetical protein Greene041619_995 [Candidatus Peregrinibacteria bacterium Greene0416_19]
MQPDRIIRTQDVIDDDMVRQLMERHVDSGQYYGAHAAEKWAGISATHPMKSLQGVSLDADAGTDPLCVVDLGPGSGKPCVAVTTGFRDRIARIVCVDVLPAMAHQAAQEIRNQTGKTVQCIIADFLRDADELRREIGALPERKVLLCLGGTVGNFRQRYILSILRSLLGERDRLLLGMGLYATGREKEVLDPFVRFLASEQNCAFGLSFLAACGHVPEYRNASAAWEDDPEESGVKVVRGYYTFPGPAVLTVGRQLVACAQGEQLQFVESRRYSRGGVEAFLQRHGLAVRASTDLGIQGLFLCQKSEEGSATGTWQAPQA